mgnify:CR=1 FL=1
MIEDLTVIALVAAGIVLALSLFNVLLASRHDSEIAKIGTKETLEQLKARVASKAEERDEILNEVASLRDKLLSMAEIQAEVQAHEKKLDELQIEWSQASERREEVAALRRQIEDVANEKMRVTAETEEVARELRERTGELDRVRDRLGKAEDLVHRIDSLTDQLGTLKAEIDEKQQTVQTLRDAEDRLTTLEGRTRELDSRAAQLEGQVTHREDQLAELATRAASEREAMAEMETKGHALRDEVSQLRGERSQARSEVDDLEERSASLSSVIASKSERLEDLQQRIADAEAQSRDVGVLRTERDTVAMELERLRAESAGLEEAVRTLQIRKETLSKDIGKLTGEGDKDDDPLRELKKRPQVIETLVNLGEPEDMSERDALGRVRQRFEAFGLEYHPRVINAFHTAMKVNESTQMAVLAGISGTGKSQLPRQYAAGMGIGFLQVPVQPRWDSPQDLMGFYNYIESKYRPTDMARALWSLDTLNNQHDAVEDRMMMLLLDEMNLARVEYYFSDFLSRLESRPSADKIGDEVLRKDAEIELEIPRAETPPRIFPGYNLLFAGTMNEDESTQSLSDKVVDRANVLRFSAPKTIKTGERKGEAPEERALSRSNWERWVQTGLTSDESRRVTDSVGQMVDVMRSFGRPFGHRLGRAISAYARVYPDLDHGSRRLNDALADQLEMRLLPKLRGVEVDKFEGAFGELRKLAESFDDTALSEAIKASVQAADDAGTGQFTWLGVTR